MGRVTPEEFSLGAALRPRKEAASSANLKSDNLSRRAIIFAAGPPAQFILRGKHRIMNCGLNAAADNHFAGRCAAKSLPDRLPEEKSK